MRVFTLLGVIFLVIGIGLVVVALMPAGGSVLDDVRVEGAGIAALTLVPMGIVFTLIGVSFGRLTATRKRLLREGVPGQATILSVGGGNMVVNNVNYMISFRLRIMLPGRAPYDTDHRQLVPIFALASLPVGGSVPVLVDPRDPTKLTIDLAGEAAGMRQAMAPLVNPAQVVPNTLSTMRDTSPNTFTADPQPAGMWPSMAQPVAGMPLPPGVPVITAPSLGGVSGATLSMVMDQLARSGITIDPAVLGGGALSVTQGTSLDASPAGQAADAALLASGSPGVALIRDVVDTGIVVRGDPVVELTIDVTPQGGAVYEVHTATLVPAAARARTVPGATVPVRIDATRPTTVAIDWLH
jgi:hypothetical protein